MKNDFFPIITNRYKEKYKGSFPSTVDSKLDTLEENLNRVKRELEIPEEKEQGSQEPNRVVSVKSRLERMEEKLNMLIERLGQTKEQAKRETKSDNIKTPHMQNSIEDNGEDCHL